MSNQCWCCCDPQTACWQRFYATWTCVDNTGWSVATPGEKQCLAPADRYKTWTYISTTGSSCLYAIDVYMGTCCTSDGDCTGVMEPASPTVPTADPSDCSGTAYCGADCPCSCDWIKLTLNFTPCGYPDCYETTGNVCVPERWNKWVDVSSFNVPLCIGRRDGVNACEWDGTYGGATLNLYDTGDTDCSGEFFACTGLTITLIRGDSIAGGMPGWAITVDLGACGRLFNGTVAVDGCTGTVTVYNDQDVCTCPDAYIDFTTSSITIEPCAAGCP